MTWLNAAFAFVFFCNLMFMVGAVYLLVRIMDSTTQSRIELLRAAHHTIEAGNHLKVVSRRAIGEMERVNDAHAARENSSARAVSELSFQIKTLIEQLKKAFAKAGARVEREHGADEGSAQSAEDLRAKLHAELNAALSKNHLLQDEIEHTRNRLKDISSANEELRHELGQVKGMKQSVMDDLMKHTTEMQTELNQARARAEAAENLATAMTVQFEALRAQINEQPLGDGVDQSGLIQSQQDQIDVMAAREKSLMERLAQMELEAQRNQTEKRFIEDRFLQMDSGDKPGSGGAT
jgi:hypothetical protein